MARLEGKTAFVTGAARGQGAATTQLFLREGANVVIADILAEEGQALADTLGEKACFCLLDVRDEDAWLRAISAAEARFGPIDILVNNAAATFYGAIEETAKTDLERLLSINLIGAFLGMKAVIPGMKARRSGSIVNISSVNGLRGTAGMGAYDATKWGVRGISKTAALELAAWKIRVNSIHPGAIDTPMLNPDGSLDSAQMARDYAIAFGRVGQPEEVAQASLFLASDEASYISGAELAVDGAWTAGLLVNSQSLGHVQ
ncbi:SDR family NAD(P)-dependent oxidoreductase [Flavisphingomonas formosensis]|uniref:SDR family NAD(P)-dependent oxidoreductase n=1 Tax=Flavisphingomonas formosensis TaxID=861534 RepID=UPI0012FA0C5E|nr:glucose 1-dehydrogenase [Sphingomonas formosensis]